MADQQGTTTVEFAIIGAALLIVLFAIVEIGRALFVMNALNESTRRGARVAVVCPIHDPAAVQAAVFDGSNGRGSIVAGLGPENILIEYLDANGTVLGDPVDGFSSIRYVRSRVVDFNHQLIIPLAMPAIPAPAFETTLPRESLGVPREGTVTPC